MRSSAKLPVMILAGAALLAPLSLTAHRMWMLPSATVLSGADPWVTVDAAVSNELFYFDHVPMRLQNLIVLAPNGSPAKAENQNTGKYRSTFDVHLTETGTYRISVVNKGVMASYEENGQPKRWRGTEETFAKEVPANAKNLQVSRSNSRMDVFVTRGNPTETVLKPTGSGLELVPVTHPNDLVAGESATFGIALNGKPAEGISVSVIPGGIRYRDQLKEEKFTTDKDGKFTVAFKEPGMYWLNATHTETPRHAPETSLSADGSPGGGAPQGPPRQPAGNRFNYVVTLEVLPQ